MELDTYRESRNFTLSEFAKMLNISLRALLNYRTGVRDWPLSLALKVEKITKGNVTVYDLAKLYKNKS